MVAKHHRLSDPDQNFAQKAVVSARTQRGERACRWGRHLSVLLMENKRQDKVRPLGITDENSRIEGANIRHRRD